MQLKSVYNIVFKPQAIKDCKKIQKNQVDKIFYEIEKLQYGLSANVKKLTNFTPEYRLRVGNYRALFEITDQIITIYRIKHRKDAYS